MEVTADCTYGTNPALLEETDDNADSADAEATAE